MTYKIIIDDGSSAVKVCREVDGQPIIDSFSSRVIDGAITTTSGFSGSSYETNGGRYSVTKSAPDTIPTNSRAYQLSDVNRVLVNHALKDIEHDEVEVLLTLPISQFFMSDGAKNTALIEEKKESAMIDVLALDGTKRPKITSVVILPEGVPAFSHAKQELDLPDGRYLIADIGGTTTDLAVFDEDSNIEKFLSIQVGALSMLNSFRAVCMGKLRVNNLADKQLQDGLITGSLLGEDVTSEAAQAVQNFKRDITRKTTSLGDFELFDAVIYSGGGAELFNNDTTILKTKSPQFDNALGSYNFFIKGV